MQKTHLWKEDNRISSSSVVTSATIESPCSERFTLWYSIPEEYGRFLTSSLDPFVLGSLFLAMRESSCLVVHGEVSPSLLMNLEEFQAAWVHWLPDVFNRVEILSDTEKEQQTVPDPNSAVVAFSGGVDAAFTAYRHCTGECGRLKRDVKAGLFVHGFDIPLNEQDVFARAAEKCEKMTNSLGFPLIRMATNFREPRDIWRFSHGLGVASCLMLLQGGFSAGLISSTEPYGSLVLPWGSNPVTDRMMSSKTFRIIHDGAAYRRSEKVKLISSWPEALDYLRVCWAGEKKDRNCGKCEKCIRTILNFRVIGAGLPACFEEDVKDSEIVKLTIINSVQLAYVEEILQLAEKMDITEPWVKALGKCVNRNKSRWRLLLRSIRAKVALRTRIQNILSSR